MVGMSRRMTFLLAAALVGSAAEAAGQGVPDTPAWRLLRASEAEQIAAVNAWLDRGSPPDDDIGVLTNAKSSLALPLFEARIECVLRSTPGACFTENGVDPELFVYKAAMGIVYAGDEEALRQMAKLVELDAARFGPLVGRTLDHAKNYSKSHNPFVVAYSGFELRNPELEKLILAWAEKKLSVDPEERARAEEAARGFGPPPPPPAEKMKHYWAEAMVDKYGYTPPEADWTSDPIASRLSPPLAQSLHDDVLRLAAEVMLRRTPK